MRVEISLSEIQERSKLARANGLGHAMRDLLVEKGIDISRPYQTHTYMEEMVFVIIQGDDDGR